MLFLSQLFPYPPDAGPKVRSYYVLRHLAQHHQLTLVAFTRPDDQNEALEELKQYCQHVYTIPIKRNHWRDIRAFTASVLTGQPFVIQRDFVPGMKQLVDQLLSGRSEFDMIHVDQLWMAQYALDVSRNLRNGDSPRLVLDEHNACFQIFERLAAHEANLLKRSLLEHEWRALKAYEAQTCARFDHVVTVTENDRLILEGLVDARGSDNGAHRNGKPEFSTIPICVNPWAARPVTPQAGAKDVLHMGTMFWLPNIEGILWFAKNVWPAIVSQVPEATFTIAGKNPPEAIKELATISPGSLNGNRPPSSVNVTGYVPDPQPYLQAAGVFIVPLLSGGGMRVKIPDAWRWGLPIVSTRIGAEGIEYRDGENILIADGAEQFAQAVVRVLKDAELAQRLRVNGRRWVEQNYDWQETYRLWDSIYENEQN